MILYLATAKTLLEDYNNFNDNVSVKASQCSNLDLINHGFYVPNTSPKKLITVSMPQFTVNYKVWLEFRDTFKSLIHDNNNINFIEKYT